MASSLVDRPQTKRPLSRAEKIAKPSTDVLQRSKCTAAIDFGTSSLSIAYTTPITKDDIKTMALHKTYERVPNAILIKIDQDNQECRVTTIGHEAQTQYCNLRKDDAKQFVYFERIKMLLKREKVSSTFVF